MISSSRQRKAQKVDAVAAERDEDGMGQHGTCFNLSKDGDDQHKLECPALLALDNAMLRI